MGRLNDKVAIVTGASSGIGRATARLFADEGAKVVVSARRRDPLDTLVEEIRNSGGEAAAISGDAKDSDLAQALVDAAVNRFGGLDIAFNNAGTMGEAVPTPDLTVEAWHDMLDTNLTSAFLGARAQIPAMLQRGAGSIIFNSTFVGYSAGMPGMAAYAASKAGLIGLTQVLASEFGAQGIRVNAILPGGTDTPMGRAYANTPETLAFAEGLHALKRLARPEEIARSVLHLASDDASFMTGAAVLVDGGVSINRV
ncbi:SDR family oxidoreductase [Bauldia sp.]|uniref:SDR family oxidoreductase n=1 Tax=Bauldia sp. TaxID=2575872 RepID=UPI003BAA3F1C